MRDVARSLLTDRGMIITQWEKLSNGWNSNYVNRIDLVAAIISLINYCYLQRWRFSVAFNPIQKWGYEDDQHLSNHITKCPFNIKYYLLIEFFCFRLIIHWFPPFTGQVFFQAKLLLYLSSFKREIEEL